MDTGMELPAGPGPKEEKVEITLSVAERIIENQSRDQHTIHDLRRSDRALNGLLTVIERFDRSGAECCEEPIWHLRHAVMDKKDQLRREEKKSV